MTGRRVPACIFSEACISTSQDLCFLGSQLVRWTPKGCRAETPPRVG